MYASIVNKLVELRNTRAWALPGTRLKHSRLGFARHSPVACQASFAWHLNGLKLYPDFDRQREKERPETQEWMGYQGFFIYQKL